MDEETQHSLECIQANQIFPRKQLIREDENLQVPFLELHGESTEYVGRAEDAIIALSNYRLHIKFKESVVNVPLQLIESVECRDIFQLHLTCKDCKVIRLCGSYPQELIVPAWITDKELESVASFRSWKRIPAVVYRHQCNGAVISRCGQPEVSWWGWRNADDEHLVQSVAKACASDARSKSSKLMNGNCSRDFSNGGDLSDVEFDSSISNASGAESLAIQPQKLLILDARSYAAAVANRAKGGGCECPEYYPNCEVVFMGMANIHSIRKSFQSLRLLCTQMPDPGNWLSALESTKWLQHLSVLLKSALLVVHAVDRDQRPVLVHCSDGWDRTPQIVALSKLLLDPYYRTIEGFQVLVEMEWLDFGHKFADRCGHGENSDDLNERCPVFLQWLDCVHQLQRQFPCSFEFNEAFLVKLVQHTYSCLFGTFLCNNAKERGEKHTQERTCSVWSLLRAANKAFKNLLYSSQSETVLYPVCHVRNLMLWSAVYLPCSSPSTPADDTCAPYPVPGSSPEDQSLGRLPKTRSFDNLTTACDSNVPTTNRRSSDPSLNEKWQEHRRSLELSSLGNPGDDPFDGDSLSKQGRALVGAELSVAAGVAEGQMENILQEATKEDVGLEELLRGTLETTGKEDEEEVILGKENRTEHLDGYVDGLYEKTEMDTDSLINNPVSNPHPVSQGSSELKRQQEEPMDLSNSIQKLLQVKGLQTVPLQSTVNSDIQKNVEEGVSRLNIEAESPPLPITIQHEAKTSNMESSTETLTENGAKQELIQKGPRHGPRLMDNSAEELSQTTENRPEGENMIELHRLGTKVNRTSNSSNTYSSMPSPCALPLTECKDEIVCNGELETENKVTEKPAGFSITQKYPAANGHCVNGEDDRIKDSLSWQVSTASCSSAQFHLRNLHHKWVHGHSGRQQTVSSPDQPTRSHLDDDGMPIYTDVIQQRLRQIETGHQQEVEILKKQVQELRSRLESQYLNSSLRFNGDYGDEVTSIPDSESNLDQNCLSRCSTEIFSEASWEQVDKQDTEVTRWLPDHLAAHCYGCDSTFWLASRKHHCRDIERVDQTWNCGNVFCSSCCNQKVPVPSQQLFEPSRVCKSCYSSLHPSSSSLDLELDKPIAASSN
ncbi:myotubularin-related protein 3 isoform X10 [Chrysemys picta bellii]|uniref:myotubularin-related protein 3 isoform X10 n=1 Tax=Chrysemys picta bellii TaxID=8478 RepID=UPI0032B2554A